MLSFHLVPTAAPLNLTVSEARSDDYLHISWRPPPDSQLHGDLVSYKMEWRNVNNLVESKGLVYFGLRHSFSSE